MKNLVIIMCDQLRKDYLSCYGNEYLSTPNIDSIANKGAQFDQCFVSNPICMPNRMSIFTGLTPRGHGMWTNGVKLGCEVPTIATYLGSKGYDTCNIGKMHFESTDCGSNTPKGCSREDVRYWEETGDNIDWTGPYYGFDHVELTIGHLTKPVAHYGKWFHEHGGKDEMAVPKKVEGFDYCPVTTMPAKLHDSSFIGDRSAEYIKEHAGSEKPFFLVSSFPDPHQPWNPPLEIARKYKDAPVKMPICEDDDLSTRPPRYLYQKYRVWHRAGILAECPGMNEADRNEAGKCAPSLELFYDKDNLKVQGFVWGEDGKMKQRPLISEAARDQRIRNTYAMIDLIDQNVGKILNALKETNQLENTIVVFTSDHGELMGDHGMWTKGPFFYDGLVNVPLLVMDPSKTPVRSDALASSIDIYPTCCDLLGLEIPTICAGISQTPVYDGKEARKSCLIEYRNGYYENDDNTFVYIDHDYKYSQSQKGDTELTDRKNDPCEKTNIAFDGQNKELVTEYKVKLLQSILETGSKYPEQFSHA